MKSRNERATMYTQTEYPQTDSGQNGLDGVQAANSQSSEALEMSPQLFLLGRKAPERAQIEAYIANKFSSTYGATRESWSCLVCRAVYRQTRRPSSGGGIRSPR